MRARGLTLVEVVVAVAILAALGLMTLQIYQVGLDAQRHSDVHELAYRNAMLGMEKVAGFVRGARVQLDEADGAVPEVVLEVPEVRDGQLVLLASGKPVYARTVTLRAPNGRMVSVEAASERPLAHLGQGSIAFQMVGPKLLEVTVAARLTGDRGEQAVYQARRRFYLPNQ